MNKNRFNDKLFEIAELTGQSFGVVTNIATKFSEQGLSCEDVLARTKDSLILARLSGLSASQAVNQIALCIKNFNSSGLKTSDIIKKLTAVDESFAVSSKDLIESLARASRAAQDVEISFNELIALTTVAQQTTARGGHTIGNALKTILSRLSRKSTINDLNKLNIKVSAKYPVLALHIICKKYNRMTEKDRLKVCELIGGVYQINIIRSIIEDASKKNSIYEMVIKTLKKV